MKKLYSLLIVVTLFSLYTAGCGDDVVVAPGNSLVTFTTGAQQGQTGKLITFSPSVDVKCTRALLLRPATNDSVRLDFPDTNAVFSANQTYELFESAQIQTGDVIDVYYTGRIASGNEVYIDVLSSVTVP